MASRLNRSKGLRPAGAVHRPLVDEDPEAMRDLAFTIIRVLDRDGQAVRSWAEGLDLTDDDLRAGLRHMMTLRAYDVRMVIAQPQQKTSFYMQQLGEEAVS